MFKNYLKTAARSLIKNKFFSLINITGLAIGIACTIIITLFVQNELNYDKVHTNYDRIYRIGADLFIGDNSIRTATMPAPAAQTFLNEYPEVEKVVRFREQGSMIIQYEDKSFKELNVLFADSSLFDVFTINVIQGDAKTALASPNSIAMSKSMANKYFGNDNPIGKVLKLDNEFNYNVTAVYDDIPATTHIKADFYASLNSLEDSNDETAWLSFNFYTYIVLKKAADIKSVEAKFPGTIDKYIDPLFQTFIGKSLKDLEKEGGHTFFFTEPLSIIYLYSDTGGQLGQVGDIKYVYIFSAIALFVLIIACINFVNLSTAHSSGRAKEVGIRKTLGSFKKDLIAQFISESVLLSLISTFVAVGLVELAIPSFNSLSAREISTNYLSNNLLLTLIFVSPLLVGFLAGAYPAFYISNFQPVAILRGKIKSGAKSGLLRSGLVILQFSASIVLLVGTITIFEQLDFIQNRKIGYNKEQVLILNDAYLLGDQAQTFKNEMLEQSGVVSATVSSFLPVPSSRNNSAVFPNNQPNDPKTTAIQIFQVDYDYIKTMGMKLAEGRDFSREFSTDTNSIIMNEAAVKHYGFENPLDNYLGAFISRNGDTKSYKVIGVVKDFNFTTLHEKVEPLVMIMDNSNGFISFRLKTNNVDETLSALETKWKEFAPTQPFSYTFMDESFNKMYESEEKLGETFGVFAGLAILIGCLGLFGLAAFTAQRRTKEIGIRKVMGASIPGIVFLMGKEFAKLVVISFAISVPISYYLMNNWLQEFAYRIDLGLYVFISAGLLSFTIAIITVSYHSLKSALTNPVKSIKYE